MQADQTADPTRTIEACRRAGEQPLSVLAPDEATRWLEQGIAIAERSHRDGDEVMARLLATLGDAKRQAGDATFRETRLAAGHRASKAGPVAREVLVAATLANSRGFASGSGLVDPERLEMLDAALISTTEDDSVVRCCSR